MKKIRLFLFFLMLLSVFLLYSCEEECAHDYETVTVDATCTAEGKISAVCKSCGDLKESVVPVKGHSFTFSVVKSTCASAGYTLFKCDCGYSYKTDITAPMEHNYTPSVTAHTCTEAGFTTYKCQNCNVSYKSDVTSPIGHSLSKKVTAPDCTKQGYTEYSCTLCEYSYISDYVDPLGHSTKQTVTSPSCTEGGFTTYSCSACEYEYKSDFTEPVGHSIEKGEVTLPTCTVGGSTMYACSSCDFEFKNDFTEPSGHDYKSETVSAVSCTEKGEVKYTCSCGDEYSVITAPNGHDFEMKITNPTVSDMGYTEFSCDCGVSYVGNYRFYDEILDNAYAGSSQVVARGIDISEWNHSVNSDGEYEPIDWVALKEAGVDYVILKIGSSLRENGTKGGIEPTFEMDYAGAKAAGIDVGVYFFTYSTSVAQIKADAELLLTYLEGKQFEYPIYLDLEPSKNENYHPENIASPILTEMLLSFFSTLQKKGYYTGLYVNNEFLFNILQTDNIIELFEIWYVRLPMSGQYSWDVNDSETFVWNTEKYGEHLGMWQYTWEGRIPTINVNVDFNFAYKDYPSIMTANGFNGYKND